jgi:DNA mismatch repair ATPase MutS
MKNGKDYLSSPAAVGGMDHVEAAILGKLAMLFPAEFRELDAYCEVNRAFLDDVIVEFDREAQFYLSYLDLMVRLRRLGLAFCLPAVSHGTRDLAVEAGYDLALAINRAKKGFGVICNDVHMENNERIFVVSGPNQGGKTTFARMFGQIHYLVALGLPLPAREARLRLADGVFTHFEKGENVSDMRGKLQDDLVRVREILHAATPDSIVILNEIFTSTTIKDATALSGYIMEAIDRLDSNCVWVTFIDEIVSFSRKAVSLVCTVSPSDPDVRTYKFERMPGNGLAYAESIARRYRLSYEEIMRRAPK